MLDFNNKKNTLRKLRRKGEQNLFWRVLCGIAAVFVRLWYDVACAVSMVFSDKHGNLFGIRGLGKGERAERRAAERQAEKKARRQDDIVYVKKPLVGRLLSAILAMSFIFMFVPDLGIDFSVFAADPLGTGYDVYDEEVSGTVWTYYEEERFSDTTGYYFYVARDFLTAYNNGTNPQLAKNIKYSASNGSVLVSWEYDETAMTAMQNNSRNYSEGKKGPGTQKLYGYTVELRGSGVKTSSVFVEADESDDYNEWVFEDVGTTGNVYAVITPKIGVMSYRFATNPIQDDGTISGSAQRLSTRNKTNDHLFDGVPTSGSSTDGATLNATLPTPTLKIVPEVIYDGVAHLTWDEVVQAGGDDKYDDAGSSHKGEPAYAYKIFKRDLTTNANAAFSDAGLPEMYTATDIKTETKSDGTSVNRRYFEYDDQNVVQGHHYQYVIQAYRVNFGTPTDAYNANNPGMVASAEPSKTGANVRADVYVAPSGPALSVKSGASGSSYLITTTATPSTGTYNGVFLFRTTGTFFDAKDIDVLTNPDNPNYAKYDGNFGKWLVENCQSGYDLNLSGDPSDTSNMMHIDFKGQKSISGSNTTLTFEDSDIVAGVTYWYYAVSYTVKTSGEWIYGTSVSKISSSLQLNLETPLWTEKVSTTDGQVTLDWDQVDKADGYELEIIKVGCHADDEQLPKIIYSEDKPYPVGKKTTYVHTRLYNDDTYTYRVRAYINIPAQTIGGVQTDKLYSNWSAPLTMVVGEPFDAPENLTATTVDGAVTLKWEPVKGATVYKVFYTNLTTGVTGEQTTTKPTYTHTNLINEELITYYVVAYKNITGDNTHGVQRYPSDESNYVTIKVGEVLGIPQDVKAETKDGEITVSWSAVNGAEGYILEYRQHGQSWDVNATDGRAIDLSRTSYNHTRLNNGDIYEYRVKAYKTVSGSRVYSEYSVVVSMTVGNVLDAPKDFTVTTSDGKATLKWTKVPGAEGYVVYASSGSKAFQFDVSKETYEHIGLVNGETWTYYVEAYKTVNAERSYSKPTQSITVTIGDYMSAAIDLTATAGNHQIDLSWSAVKGAEGYVVYLYNSKTMEFEPIAVVSGTNYSHIGLKNGTKYTYMVAPFKTSNGTRVYGDYSITVTATPTTGSPTDIDRELNVKGTAPYGISHSEYISADSNHDAFDESVDVYFTTNKESTQAVKDVLKNYANGLSSFVIYPFDISIYKEGTKIAVSPADGYTVTITMPIPDILIAYRDYLTVVHINDHNSYIQEDEIEGETIYEDWYTDYGDQRLEVLPCAIVDIDNIWCVQFKCSSFSPYAIVIYKEHIQDVSAGWGIFDGTFAGTFNTGGLLLFTALPDILPQNKKLRVVRGKSRRYRIKSVEKK